MAITDKRPIAFSDELLRPIAEKMRDLKVDIDAAIVKWNSEISTLVPNDVAELLEDGRESFGVSRLFGADLYNLMTQMIAFQTQMDQPGVADVISKPTVRPVKSSS